MKKTGFTLSELLITLTVIGVVSALVLPAVSGILPDKNKAKVIKYNAMLNNYINEIFADESIYCPYTAYDTTNGNTFLTIDGNSTTPCYGLSCIKQSLPEDYTRTAFEYLLENKFFPKVNKDGSSWDVQQAVDPSDSTKTGIYWVEVKTDGKKLIPYSTGAKNVNTFYFNIDEYGNVKPGDALTEAFLKNYKKLNDRNADIEDAEAIQTAITSNNRNGYYTKETTSN